MLVRREHELGLHAVNLRVGVLVEGRAVDDLGNLHVLVVIEKRGEVRLRGVIEEGIGPGGQYNLCSIERTKDLKEGDTKEVSIGWFPCSCLEKIEKEQKIKKKQ